MMKLREIFCGEILLPVMILSLVCLFVGAGKGCSSLDQDFYIQSKLSNWRVFCYNTKNQQVIYDNYYVRDYTDNEESWFFAGYYYGKIVIKKIDKIPSTKCLIEKRR